MISEFIARQLEHRYRVLVRSLGAGLTEELLWRPLGERPPIGWHACHIAAAMASTAEAGEATSYGSAAPQVLIAEVNRLSFLLLSALKSLTDDDLERPPLVDVHLAFRSTLTSRMVFLEGHLFHVTYHLGAIGVLRAEWRLEP